MKQKSLQKLFEKKMDRKEFLAHIGVGAMAVVGVSGLLKNLLDYGGKPTQRVSSGYGSSSYGGTNKGRY